MAPPIGLLKAEAPGDPLFRRLAVAPDYAALSGGAILATWGARSVPVITAANNKNSADEVPSLCYDRSLPWVGLPYPAMDVVWCPFKKGNSYATFLTACRSCPLQMWDLDDASLRASYCCYNAAGMLAYPHSTLWSRHRTLVAAGYGGSEDNIHVRLYDVLREGSTVVSSYRSPCSKGIVSALSDGPAPCQEKLLLAGFMRSGNVDIVDTRHCGAAAVLRGLRSGVAQVSAHPTAEHMVYAAGRLGDKRIVCWDTRKCNQLLATFEREVRTQQPVHFGFVQRTDTEAPRVDLVSATHDGGVLVFDEAAAAAKEVTATAREPRRVGVDLGPTAGLAVLDTNGVIAVTVGEKRYAVQDRCEANTDSPGTMRKPAKRSRDLFEGHDLESDEDSEIGRTAGGIAVLSV
ncbi:transducin family protein / WD-40 repeat family protein [Trypanosoma grayi]|uniref:transducin family protein / WD-40 repeat family protein n=1 Tax=Trypanosoma grayi TaxID=71804 RepID=UPI0004F3F05F|nr:transducin family protein / WD-40 repeat family protein [Trypanosoma grayi]KEG15598.1 transducin family protein / WD-40 repeat family protein [Trypanosoma grayi]